MPIRRVEVVHKFGIISHSKRLELQQRLAEKVIDESVTIKRPSSQRKSQFTVNEDFVRQFNEAEAGSEERLELELRAEKIFLRAKRKTGLQQGGIGSHVSIDEAWIELSLLAQCNSRSLQDAALNTLHNSLYYLPISKNHIKSLLYLGHASMQWLTESNATQPYLRTGELGLIKVAHMIFIRLYYHHLAADIVGLHEERRQLIDIVDAFDQQQEIYRPFPSSLLFLRTIVQIGGCLKVGLEDELRKLASQIVSINQRETEMRQRVSAGSVSQDEVKGQHGVKGQSEVKGLFTAEFGEEMSSELDDDSYRSLFHEVMKEKSNARLVPGVPTIHDASPTLWHSLDLWRILTHTNQVPEMALKELVQCSLDFVTEPMLDSILALRVLSEAAKINHKTLLIMQQIARRDVLGISDDANEQKPTKYRLAEQFSPVDSTQMLSDSLLLTKNDITSEYMNESVQFAASKHSKDKNKFRTDEIDGKKGENSVTSTLGFVEQLREFLHPKPMGTSRWHSEQAVLQRIGDEDSLAQTNDGETLHIVNKTANHSEKKDNLKRAVDNVAGGHFGPNYNDEECDHLEANNSDCESRSHCDPSFSDGSLADLSSLASNQPHTEVKMRTSRRRLKKRNNGRDTGLSSDESEAELQENTLRKSRKRNAKNVTRESSMSIGVENHKHVLDFASPAHTITRPNTESSITIKTKWPWELVVSYVRGIAEVCLNGSQSKIQRDALMGCPGNDAGLLQLLKFQLQVENGSNIDWSWRVRHVTVQQLMKVCQMKQRETLKDGLQNAAWAALLSHHSTEVDRRVLEAYKIGRTEANLENCEGAPVTKTSVYARISTNLAIIHVASIDDHYDTSRSDVLPRDTTFLEQKSLKKSGSDRDDQGVGRLETGERPKEDKRSSIRGRSQRGDRSKASEKSDRAKVSIRDEIMIAKALDQDEQPFGLRSWRDVQNVVEDQWRKELVEEYEIMEKERQHTMDKEIETMRKSITRQSLKERIKY